MDRSLILTVGHSSHSADRFLGLLGAHAVSLLVDVRSIPHSGIAPDFNRHSLAKRLEAVGIRYDFMGDELGGRSRVAGDYDPTGRVRYERMAASESFTRGLGRVLARANRHRVALLCAEKEPLDCHRTLLVARELEKLGAAIAHIHEDGRLETNDAAMSRLLALHGMQDQALFDSRERLIEEACRLQAQKVAFIDRRMQWSTPAPLA